MTTETALMTLSQTFLDVCQDALENAAPAITVPTRTYVADGAIAVDCDQLAVGVYALYLGLPGKHNNGALERRGANGRAVGLQVVYSVCVPVEDERGRAPTTTAIEASATGIMAAGWVIFNGILDAWRSGTLQDACAGLAFVSADPLGPEGGYGGWTIRFEAQL